MACGVLLTEVINKTSPLMGSLALLGALGLGLIFLFPGIGLILTAIVIPIERLGRFTNDDSMYTVSLMRIVGMATLGAFLVHTAIRRGRLRFSIPLWIYLVYWSYGILTIFWTNDRLGGIRAASAMLGNLLFLFLIINMVRDWPTAKKIVLLWLAASVAIGIFTIYQWHSGNRGTDEVDLGATSERFSTMLKDNSEWESLDQVERALGPTSSPAVYAINMIMTLPFLFYFYRSERSVWARIGVFASGLIVLYNIFLANTRAAIILAALVVTMCLARRMIQLTPVVILSLTIFLGVILIATPSAVYHRVLDASNYSTGRSGTLRSRLAYWEAGVRIASEYWYKGTGIGNQAMVPKYAKIEGPEFSSVHNEYLNTFLEVGLFGWIVFFSFPSILLMYSFRAARYFRRWRETQEQYWFMVACQITMISVLIFAVQVDVYHFPLKGWWLVASMTVVLDSLAKQSQQDTHAEEGIWLARV